MPKGDWSRYYTIGLIGAVLFAVAAALWIYAPATLSEADYQREAEERSENYANRADIAAANRCADVSAAELAQCMIEERESARPDQREEYDLEAQRTMAVWTRAMGAAAIVGMAVGIVGVYLIFVTFRETRSAAAEAKRSVNAFMDAERARLAVVRPNLASKDGDNPQYRIGITVANFGRSPCKVTAVHWAGVDDVAWHEDFKNTGHAQRSVEAVVPPDSAAHKLDAVINIPLDKPYVAGHVIYDTQFKKGCRSHFLWRLGELLPSDYGQAYAYLHEQGGKGWPEDT